MSKRRLQVLDSKKSNIKKKPIIVADLYCGGGGTSTGMINAFIKNNVKYKLIGVNHWNIAIETNRKNHPEGTHYCAPVQNIHPREAVPGGRLHFFWASPECTNHSKAKGGRPKDEQSRATAWDVLKWAQELYIDRVYIENVAEFMDWGPMDTKGRPIKSKKGNTFRAFIKTLEAMGYCVDYQVMNAADFGAPTNRKRLIIQAVRGKNKIVWPEITHSDSSDNLFGWKPYVAAREIIDWDLPGQSIFTRKKPLAENTLKRIEAGIQKYWGEWAEPFLIILRGQSKCRDINSPMPTITAGGPHVALIEPFLVKLRGTNTTANINAPAPTITAGGTHLGLAQPFIVPNFGEKDGQAPRTHSIDDPLPTVTSHGAGAIVQPFITRYNGGEDRNQSINDPLSTVDCSNRFGVIEPFITRFNSGNPDQHARDINNPLDTITCNDRFGMVEPIIIATGHTKAKDRSRSVNEPLSTVVTKAEHCLVEPFLVKYYGNEQHGQSIEKPLDTITTKERFAIIDGCPVTLDIRFRMLQPHELAAAMSFPADYEFAGNKGDKVKQIGNAVPPKLAEALINAALIA